VTRKRGAQGKRRHPDKPRLEPRLKTVFRRIGVPESTLFRPDPFQIEALERLAGCDVLVSAPTGAGKTWIAAEAVRRYLARRMRIWYASPLKALSNAIYGEFCHEFGRENCGILTGDRKEHPDASIIVGTTEILRNQLYDAMHEGSSIRADLVILDEAHYLSDPDRGVVWEEVLIYLPPRVRLLLLSATISNGEEIAAWLEGIRGAPATVVRSHERPVPLEMLFLFPDGLLAPLAGRKGLTPRVKKFVSSRSGGRRAGRSARPDFEQIIRCLRSFDLLPAIFFLKSRADCNRALQSCLRSERSPAIRDRVQSELKAFLADFPHLGGHRQMRSLIECGVGAHHAGQLPYWKMLVERLMKKGLLEAIFSTSTVAAGVNFPARTVVLVQSDRYDGHEFINLTATDLHQMIGRAGRRGKDNIGFALVIPGLHQDPQLIHELKDASPEPIESQIHINFSMTLNLLLSHQPEEVRDLLDRSLAAFQERRAGSSVQERWNEMLRVLNNALPRGRCDTADPHEVLENIQRREELRKETRGLSKELRDKQRVQVYKEYLKPGRLFLHKKGGVFVTFHTYAERGRQICAAHNIQRPLRTKRRRIKLRKIPFEKVKGIFDYRVSIPADYSMERLQRVFDGIDTEGLALLTFEPMEEEIRDSARQERVEERLSLLPCEDCEHFRACHTAKDKALKRLLADCRKLAFQLEAMGGGSWMAFKRHLRFLKETGFVNGQDRLTPDGLWASKLRLDHPLLIAEAIRKGSLKDLSPAVLAGCIAPFVWDRAQEPESRLVSPLDLETLDRALGRVLRDIDGIRKLKVRRGFDNPPISEWPAVAVYLWAKDLPWERLHAAVRMDEGDIVSLVIRTADHLRQVSNLYDTHPGLASAAEEAISLMAREPVQIY
jgi:superfamily II RNA helicase